MSYNGSGTFLINTAGQPVVSGTVISSTAFNALTADLATGLSTAITKDGQTTVTANIPMSTYKFTGLGAGSAATDSANLSQVQSTVVKLLASVSGADTITAVANPTLAAYAAGQMFYFVAAGANTGAVTININSLGAKSITRDGTTALASGDIQSGEVCVIVYDGTQFQLVNGASQSASIVTENLTVNKATVLNESGGDNDTRIEGDTDANLFFADASTDRIGIGTSSPSYKFNVVGTSGTVGLGLTGTHASGDIGINIAPSAITGSYTAINSAPSASTGVGYNFGNGNNSSSSAHSRVDILTTSANGGDPKLTYTISGVLNWCLGVDNSDSDKFKISASDEPGTSDWVTITSGGNVGVNVTTPAQKLHVLSPTSYEGILINGNQAPNVSFATSTNTTPAFKVGLSGNNSANFSISTGAAATDRVTVTGGGLLLVGKTATSISTIGIELDGPSGASQYTTGSEPVMYINREGNDGDLIRFFQASAQEGSISVSGNTVSYNAFAGSHWSQLQDGSKPDILRGTVMESINELCEWPGEQNERLPKSKISDTAGSKKVYGVFMAWDNDWTTTNDMYVTAVGAFICRVNGSVTVQEGDLLESNGDGTARVQADDIIRSSTIGKVTSTVKTHEYDDGSYCVPTVLYCG